MIAKTRKGDNRSTNCLRVLLAAGVTINAVVSIAATDSSTTTDGLLNLPFLDLDMVCLSSIDAYAFSIKRTNPEHDTDTQPNYPYWPPDPALDRVYCI